MNPIKSAVFSFTPESPISAAASAAIAAAVGDYAVKMTFAVQALLDDPPAVAAGDETERVIILTQPPPP